MIPLVSVCIVTFNQEKFISELIESILSQDIASLQLIIADDASTDSTPKIIKEYKRLYPHIIDLILHKNNKGIAGNIESTYEKIRGKYVCWVGGDDIYLPDKLKIQSSFLNDNEDYIASYHDVHVKDDNKKYQYQYNHKIYGNKPYSGKITGKLIRHRCFISAFSFMIRSSILSQVQHRKEFGACNDWLFFIEVSEVGKIYFHQNILGIYRRHDSNYTRNNFIHSDEENIYNFLKKKHLKTYPNDIFLGLLSMHVSHFFKYLLLLNFRGCSHSFNSIQEIVKQKKRAIFFIFRILSVLFFKITFLYIKTRSLFR